MSLPKVTTDLKMNYEDDELDMEDIFDLSEE